jgi:hypothetical protein
MVHEINCHMMYAMYKVNSNRQLSSFLFVSGAMHSC